MAIAVIVVFGLGGACGGGSKDARQPRSTASERAAASTTSKVTPAPTEATTTTTAKDETSTTTSMLADSAPLKAFEGSGVWIDVYEWSPSSTDGSPGVTPDQVADMAAAGMTTLYIQSARTSRAVDVADPERFREFVDASHAHGMDVVSWYLPNHTDPETDLRRLLAPLEYGVDGIGIDLESKNLADRALRNERAIDLVRNAADLAGDVPVGAVVFAPQALSRYEPDTWPDFPWAEVAAEADLMVPMAYWTIYAEEFPESDDPVAYTAETLALLRSLVGPDTPIHSAGGLLGESDADEVTAAVETARKAGAIGVSMYSWSGVEPGQLASMQEEPR